MPHDQNQIIEANRSQAVSESDSFTADRYRQFYRHFPAHAKTVLDVGCNTGRGGAVLKICNPGIELAGIDCVPERIAALDKKIYDRSLCGFSTQIPAGDGSFDAVVAGEFIEHLPPNQVGATLAEFFRVLRLNGRLLMTTPNPGYLKNRFKHLSVLQEGSHLSQHHPDSLAARLRMTGFSRVKIFVSGRVSRLIGQRFPFLPCYGSYLVRGDKW
jgi:ubiquinone/menaquinone biosynthesis C-methylase UbiE